MVQGQDGHYFGAGGFNRGAQKQMVRKEYFPVAASLPKKYIPQEGGFNRRGCNAGGGGMVINRVPSIGAMVTTTLQKMHSVLAFVLREQRQFHTSGSNYRPLEQLLGGTIKMEAKFGANLSLRRFLI